MPEVYRVPTEVRLIARAALPGAPSAMSRSVARELASGEVSERRVRQVAGYHARGADPAAAEAWGGEAGARWARGVRELLDARAAGEE